MENKQDEETFLAKVAKGSRITIYEPVREFLGIGDGDILRVTVQMAKKGESPSEVEPTPVESVVEEPEEVIEEEPLPPSEVEEEPLPEELKEEVVEPEVEEPLDEPEAVSEEPEYKDYCPHHLSSPLEDQEVCLEWKCEHYRRKYGDRPVRCTWPGWKKEGSEDEELPVDEPEQEEPIEEATESEVEFAMLFCAEGTHKAEVTPHRKRDIDGGWVMCTCTICGNETPVKLKEAEGVE